MDGQNQDDQTPAAAPAPCTGTPEPKKCDGTEEKKCEGTEEKKCTGTEEKKCTGDAAQM